MPTYIESPLGVRDLVRQTLAGAGLTEVITSALVSPRWSSCSAGRPETDRLAGDDRPTGRPIRAVNPLSADHSVLRQGLVGSLLEVVATNLDQGRCDVAVFELGKGYAYDEPASAVHEWWRLGLALTGASRPAAWDRAAEVLVLDDAKGLIELLAARLGLARAGLDAAHDRAGLPPGPERERPEPTASSPAAPASSIPRSGPSWTCAPNGWSLPSSRSAGLNGGAAPEVRVEPIPRFPPVGRDLAVVVDRAIPAAAVERVIRSAAGDLLRNVQLFDIYRGTPLSRASRAWPGG